MTKERVFKKEYASELLRIAEADFQTAEVLAREKISRNENILFHIEQAIEKAIKAFICSLSKPVPMTHDLFVLLDRIPAEDPIPHAEELDDLSQFATIRRYEEGSAIFSIDEIQSALKAAREILDWAGKRIKGK
jgi:HEPN domain-containing protein